MSRLWLSMLLVLTCLSPTAAAGADVGDCKPVQGVEVIAARAETYLLFGEIHGTVEAPALFGEIVCHLAKTGRPLIVGLELEEIEQATLTQVVTGEGTAAFEPLRAIWAAKPEMGRDGRRSAAIRDLILRLRELRTAGLPISVFAISPIFEPHMFEDRDKMTFHKGAGLMRSLRGGLLQAGEGARAITLTGNVHAMLPQHDDIAAVQGTFASQLPREEMLNFNLATTGGASWTCRHNCGVHPVQPQLQGALEGMPLHVAITELDSGARFNGRWFIGPATASPPVVQAD